MSHVDRMLKEGEYVWINFKEELKKRKDADTANKLEEDAIDKFKQSEKAYREFIHRPIHAPIHVGNGIWDQIDSIHPKNYKLRVEDLYEFVGPNYWFLIDYMLSDRPDLQDRIEKYKKENGK